MSIDHQLCPSIISCVYRPLSVSVNHQLCLSINHQLRLSISSAVSVNHQLCLSIISYVYRPLAVSVNHQLCLSITHQLCLSISSAVSVNHQLCISTISCVCQSSAMPVNHSSAVLFVASCPHLHPAGPARRGRHNWPLCLSHSLPRTEHSVAAVAAGLIRAGPAASRLLLRHARSLLTAVQRSPGPTSTTGLARSELHLPTRPAHQRHSAPRRWGAAVGSVFGYASDAG